MGTAHVLLLGLLVDFWAQWLPAPKSKKHKRLDTPAAKYKLPNHIRKAISDKTGHIMLTELFKKPYRDITR